MNRSISAQPVGFKSQQQQTSIDQPTLPTINTRSFKVIFNPSVLKMAPPATLRNWKFYRPLLAVGSATGTIQIYDLMSERLHRELSVHNYIIRGIEWIGLNAFISYAVSESFQGNDSNWELHATELATGRSVQLKSGRSSETSVIQSVKASHLRQYFIVVYKNDPFEIWDRDTLTLLRRVPKKFTGIISAEWSPLYSKRADSESKPNTHPAPLRENFVVTNKLGELFHFSIVGCTVKEISKIPPESTMTKPVTAIAWKSDHVVLGRNDGNISVWNLGQKEARTVSTMRGAIQKIRFAPGRGNMKILILFSDGVDIWDVRKLKLISTIILDRSQTTRIEDADWAASDRPVLLTTDPKVVVSDLLFSGTGLKRAPDKSDIYRVNNEQQNNEPCYLQ